MLTADVRLSESYRSDRQDDELLDQFRLAQTAHGRLMISGGVLGQSIIMTVPRQTRCEKSDSLE